MTIMFYAFHKGGLWSVKVWPYIGPLGEVAEPIHMEMLLSHTGFSRFLTVHFLMLFSFSTFNLYPEIIYLTRSFNFSLLFQRLKVPFPTLICL